MNQTHQPNYFVLEVGNLWPLVWCKIAEGDAIGECTEQLPAQLLHQRATFPPPRVGLLRSENNQEAQDERKSAKHGVASASWANLLRLIT